MKHLNPTETHAFLAATPDAVFIDCRSEIEFMYVGHPVGATHIAWQDAPDWEIDPAFATHVAHAAKGDKTRPIVLICRSGKRTLDAGDALESAGFSYVINVLEGFEGELDDNFHRGTTGGWRFRGLPWQQM
jgi:rhodanese-related sulfurtransferase